MLVDIKFNLGNIMCKISHQVFIDIIDGDREIGDAGACQHPAGEDFQFGGQAVLFIAEGIMRRRPSLKVVEKLNMAGFAILIGIFVFATYSDIMRIKNSHDGKKAREAAAAQAEPGTETPAEEDTH